MYSSCLCTSQYVLKVAGRTLKLPSLALLAGITEGTYPTTVYDEEEGGETLEERGEERVEDKRDNPPEARHARIGRTNWCTS